MSVLYVQQTKPNKRSGPVSYLYRCSMSTVLKIHARSQSCPHITINLIVQVRKIFEMSLNYLII